MACPILTWNSRNAGRASAAHTDGIAALRETTKIPRKYYTYLKEILQLVLGYFSRFLSDTGGIIHYSA